LVFFDEIQDAPGAAARGSVGSFKYFKENAPELHIIGAGSHIGLTKNEEPFPVGAVSFLTMYPMSFYEFLKAI
jgi:predicted AAA+ superfamily ATPase